MLDQLRSAQISSGGQVWAKVSAHEPPGDLRPADSNLPAVALPPDIHWASSRFKSGLRTAGQIEDQSRRIAIGHE